MLQFLGIALLACSMLSNAFILKAPNAHQVIRHIAMANGRSQAEIGLSKRQMYRKIRDKLNTAAKAPGFFSELGDVPVVSVSLIHSQLRYPLA